jgi:plastocyanin
MRTYILSNRRSEIALGIFALIVIAYGIYALLSVQRSGNDNVVPVQSMATSTRIAPPNAAVVMQLQESHGFQAFVSYTDGSFQPATSTIKVGQTIRFTNNSSNDIWVGQITSENTPSDPNTQGCDVQFNSCHALRPGNFAEFTFPAIGTFYYMDNLDTATRGAVIVE